MDNLIVINYEGERYKLGKIENFKLRFEKDCGLLPMLILDQPSREEFFSFFQNYSQKADKLIIHIKSHGNIEGICQVHVYSDDGTFGDKNSLIKWEELIQLFNNVSKNCNDLILNLGTVCNSINIKNCNIDMNFYTLVTTSNISDPVKPRKLNKELLTNLKNIRINSGFKLLKKVNASHK